MSLAAAASSAPIYILVIVGLFAICLLAAVYMAKAWRQAKLLGYTNKQLMGVVKSAITVSIMPSIATMIGMFAVAAMLGLPWAWWRLSVVGSLQYETTAANIALTASGVELATATVDEFVSVLWVMTIGIMSGMIIAPFLTKGIHMGSMSLKKKDTRQGTLCLSMCIVAIIIALAEPLFFDADHTKMMVLLTSAAISWIMKSLARISRRQWLNEMVMPCAMILSMVSSLVWIAVL